MLYFRVIGSPHGSKDPAFCDRRCFATACEGLDELPLSFWELLVCRTSLHVYRAASCASHQTSPALLLTDTIRFQAWNAEHRMQGSIDIPLNEALDPPKPLQLPPISDSA